MGILESGEGGDAVERSIEADLKGHPQRGGAMISADRPAHAGPHRDDRLFNRERVPGIPHAAASSSPRPGVSAQTETH
jgi:hypothetical protein